jgi:hypothetical protein
MELIPVKEAKFATFGNPSQTGPIIPPPRDKAIYLKENFNCPMDTHPAIMAQYEALIVQKHNVFADNKFDIGFLEKNIPQNQHENWMHMKMRS